MFLPQYLQSMIGFQKPFDRKKRKAIFIFKKNKQDFFALLIISKKNEDIAISNTGLAVILLSV